MRNWARGVKQVGKKRKDNSGVVSYGICMYVYRCIYMCIYICICSKISTDGVINNFLMKKAPKFILFAQAADRCY